MNRTLQSSNSELSEVLLVETQCKVFLVSVRLRKTTKNVLHTCHIHPAFKCVGYELLGTVDGFPSKLFDIVGSKCKGVVQGSCIAGTLCGSDSLQLEFITPKPTSYCRYKRSGALPENNHKFKFWSSVHYCSDPVHYTAFRVVPWWEQYF